MKKKKEQVKKNYREYKPSEWAKVCPEVNDRNKFYLGKKEKRNGKGDSRRERSVDYETWSENYDAIFGKKKDEEDK